MLVPNLDVVVVVFKLDNLRLIFVNCPPIPWSSRIWTILGMCSEVTTCILLVPKICLSS